MSFLLRVFFVFVVALFADRLVVGIEISNYRSLQESLFSFVIAILNALVRTFVHLFHWSYSWRVLGFYGLILNGIIYGLLAGNQMGISGPVSRTPISALSVGFIVWIAGVICNHYVLPKS